MKNRIVYLAFKRNDGIDVYARGHKYIDNQGSLVSYSLGGKFMCVTTTMGCLEKNGWMSDLDYEFDEPTYHQIPNERILKMMFDYVDSTKI